jgi:hypothetical protein
MRVIIAGSRCFKDYNVMEKFCDRVLSKQNKEDVVIISGTARGADTLGEEYAEKKGYRLEKYPADWKTHGNRAGIIRNCHMGDIADALIAFHDGQSRGTLHMIDYAKKKKLKVRVKYF